MGIPLFFLAILGIALGFFEASVVVYLRARLYPGSPLFPMQPIPADLLKVEVLREAASILLIWAAAVSTGRTRALKTANFFFIFGLWDIFYYVFLKIFLNWPAAWMDWDILFLIPAPWLAPVLAPVLCSVTLILYALEMHRLGAKGFPLPITRSDGLMAAVSSALILISFFKFTGPALNGAVPSTFSWPLFLSGLVLAWAYALRRRRRYIAFIS
jgi:hypothetical protein